MFKSYFEYSNRVSHFSFQRVRKELEELKKQYAVLQKQTEEETVQRVDLQNRIQSLKEELAFKSSVHERVGLGLASLAFD